ncbi:SPOR domain-containing protein [Campylobacter lari]|uniref:SPOR domain-containing protein n=1 Tax=Campylobacter lari TaxID=201 RepID=A0A5L8LPH1_CAMLA|nr:SPOR domain-containing protein [Campylobacter lari]EAK9940534.1 SPOR domain-containing protein [Campylobacter lari]MCR2076232.1 SPOR domain-containing protein [Campylobacter lari subsp. concheus]MCR2083807.1 SPOR domain-containing protein [Campylobacter lari subsp. concheus]MCR2085422.1 SPOR domain-containing protein [Campylobacter lari subsp. concheus]MCV3419040.1 SPOR domain-containing protein [Campylobacter lari]
MEENNKNEFDDIILQKSNKSEKLKKILLRSIILIIVFLVVMIVMKLINDPGEEKALQMPSEPQEQAAYENNFNSLPITDSAKEEDEFEALARKLKEESSLNDTNTTIEEKQEVPSNSVLDQITTVEPKEEPAKVEEKQEEIKPIEKPTQKPSEKPKNNIIEQQKAPEQSNTNELFESIKTPNVQTQLLSGAYIQVFSLNSLDPKSKELNILKENGYDYKIYKTTVNGKELTKVLVGPYKESELKAELEKVRSKIAKGAFTFRVK